MPMWQRYPKEDIHVSDSFLNDCHMVQAPLVDPSQLKLSLAGSTRNQSLVTEWTWLATTLQLSVCTRRQIIPVVHDYVDGE